MCNYLKMSNETKPDRPPKTDTTAVHKPQLNIELRAATADDYDAVLAFLRKHYYPEEPLTMCNEPKQQSVEDEQFTMSCLTSGTTVLAHDNGSRELVGVLVSSGIDADAAEHGREAARKSSSKKWADILWFLSHLAEVADVCKRFNARKAVHVHAMGVDAKVRGHSIGMRLIQKCMEIGKQMGYPILSIDCTSVYSIRFMESLGAECVHVLRYEDWRDKDGVQTFSMPMPHLCVKTFVVKL